MGHNGAHKQLVVWKKSMDLAQLVHVRVSNFPREERYELASQMRRCALSIPANIAEGAARHTIREYVHFLYIARGSLSELDTYVEFSFRLGYLLEEDFGKLYAELSNIGRMLNALITSLHRT